VTLAAGWLFQRQARQRTVIWSRSRTSTNGHAIASHLPIVAGCQATARRGRQGDQEPGRYLTPGYVEIQRATCWLVLGRPERTIPVLERELASLPAIHRRDRGVYTARLATAYAAAGDHEQAAATARQAREIGMATGSRRILRELRPAGTR
jgi:hypothetical protein